MLNSPDTPIELADDGFRYITHGNTKRGGYRFICQGNPSHVAQTIAARKHRELIQAANFRYDEGR